MKTKMKRDIDGMWSDVDTTNTNTILSGQKCHTYASKVPYLAGLNTILAKTILLVLLFLVGGVVSEVWGESYTYIVINHSGEQAIKETVTETSGQTPDITRTTKIASPLVTKWFYYSDEECTTIMSTLPASDATIYVRYSHNYNRELFNLNRNIAYQIKYGDYYFSNNGNNKDLRFFQATNATLTSTPGYASWTFDGNDPYRIQLFNYATTNGYPFLHENGTDAHMYPGQSPGNMDTKFFTILNSPTCSGKYIVAAVCVPNGKYKALRKNGEYAWGRVENAVSNINNDDCCFTIVNDAAIAPSSHNYTYYVVNKSGEVTVWNFCKQSAGTAPHIPDIIKTPLLADNAFHYYTYSDSYRTAGEGVTYGVWSDLAKWNTKDNTNDIVPYGKYTIPGGTAELTTLPAANTKILVTYDANPTIQEVNGLTIDINGGTSYNINLENTNNTGYLYSDGSNFARNTGSVNETTLASQDYLWSFGGNDPYNIQLRSEKVGNTYQLANNETSRQSEVDPQNSGFSFQLYSSVSRSSSTSYPFNSFILMQGDDGKFELMYTYQKGMSMSGGNIYSYAYPYLSTNNAGNGLMIRGVWRHSVDASRWAHGGRDIQVVLTPSLSNCDYNFKLVRNGDVESTVTVADKPAGGSIASIMPASMEDANASGYLFYPTLADALAGTNAITTLPFDKSLSVDIFVVCTYAAVSVTYRIINKSSKLVFGDITGTFTPDNTPEENLPNAYQSPLATNYRFYTNGGYNSTADTYTPTNPIDQTSAPYIPAANDVIYVLYDYNPSNSVTMGSNTLTIDLTGNTVYKWNLQSEGSPKWQMVNGSTSTVTFNGKNVTRVQLDQSHTDTPSTWTGNFLWTLEGSDPYDIVIRNVTYPDYFYSWQDGTGSPTGKTHKYVWNETQATASGAAFVKHWALLTGNKLFSENAGDGYVLFHHDDGWANRVPYTSIASNNEAEVLFSLPALVTYHVVNKSNQIAISKQETSGSTIAMPTELKSPYITNNANYLFFNTQADAYAYSSAADAAARTAAATKAISGTSKAGQVVYVGYYYDELQKPAALPGLSESPVWYQMFTGTNNYFYLSATTSTNPIYAGTNAETTSTPSTDDNYLWRFLGGDPYGFYIQNREAVNLGEQSGGTYDWANKSKLTFDQMHLVNGGSSYFIGGKYSAEGTSFVMLKVGTEYNIVRVNPGEPIGGQFYLQFLKADNSNPKRVVMYNNSNSPVPAAYTSNLDKDDFKFYRLSMANFRFHLTTHIGTQNLVELQLADITTDISLPEILKRKFCRYEFYLNSDLSTSLVTTYKDVVENGTLTDEAYDIYVKYSTSDALGNNLLPFEVSTSNSAAHWYVLHLQNASNLMYRSQNANPSNNKVACTTSPVYDSNYCFAFTGDPYELQIINKAAGDGKFLGVPAGSTGEKKPWFYSTDDSPIITYELVDGTNYDDNQFRLRVYGTTDYFLYYLSELRYNNTQYNNLTSMAWVEELPEFTYTYNIVDNTGRIAIKYTLKSTEKERTTTTLGSSYTTLPEAIRSPYIDGETLTFYATATQRNDGSPVYDADGRTVYDLSNPITERPGTDGANIYVRYTTDLAHLMDMPLHLRGVRGFDMKINGHYIYDNSGSIDHESTTANKSERNHLWHFKGLDPYAVQVENVGTSRLFTHDTTTPGLSLGSATTNTYFILMQYGNDYEDETEDAKTVSKIKVELMAASCKDLATENYHSVGRTTGDGNNASLFANATGYEHGNDAIKILLNVGYINVNYNIVDKAGKIVVANIPGEESGGVPYLPDSWRSPMASNFYYWQESNFTAGKISAATFELKEGDHSNTANASAQITSISDPADGKIYVTYDVNSAIDLNGSQNRDNEGKTYLLKFANGGTYQLENGSDGLASAQKAVYPYNNGEANLYVYDSDRWSNQHDAAASTRTRWAWYLESVNSDPYRVKVASFQNYTLTEPDKSGEANKYLYLHTYVPDPSIGVVTGVTTTHSAVTARDAADVPTEYMILGTTGHYKLLTSDLVSGSHQTVTSFESYWKNNPTVKNVLTSAGYTTPTADITEGSSEWNYLKNTMGWHEYSAWGSTGTPDQWTSVSTKRYKYEKHWFLQVDMGDGEFDFEEVTINGALVLLDQHGWEIMRKPTAKKAASNKAAIDAAISIYDSPMVERYHFFYNFSKRGGYHKYFPTTGQSNSNNNYHEVGTGTSLADYTNFESALSNNGTLRDVYVTYDVKPAYTATYTGTTVSGDGTPTLGTPTSFLVQQGNKYATNGSGTLSPTDVPTEGMESIVTGTVTNDMLWYLQPNVDIDREMGFIYSGESGEQDYAPTQEELESEYVSEGKNGFDPYNLQIRSAADVSKYFVTNATGGVGTPATTLNNADGITRIATETSSLSLGSNSEKYTAVDHDSRIVHVTNATFMVVQDANGNMHLMPRFDHSKVTASLSSMADPTTAAATADDDGTNSPLTTLFFLPNKDYVYVIVDNEGHEALRYTSFGDTDPIVPLKFKSPLATDFTFYTSTSFSDENRISSLVNATLTDKTIYVRYSYNPTADADGLLQGTWYNAKLNGSDVKVTTDGIVKESFTNDVAHRWRFMQNASSKADPYAVTLWNGTPATEACGNRYIIMKPATGVYALIQAGNSSTTEYKFLDGSSIPTITPQTGYQTLSTIADTKYLTLTPVLPATTITYHIITRTGQVALVGKETYTEAKMKEDDFKFSLPEWMRSPLMKNTADTYNYYAAITGGAADAYTQGQEATVYNLNGDGVVYVRYDYEKSRIAFTDFKFMTNYLTEAPIDLSGQVPYVISIGGNHNLRQVEKSGENANTVTLQSNGDNLYNSEMRMKGATSWLLYGNDPYEVSFINPTYSTTKVLAAQTPAGVVTSDGQNGVTMYMAEPDDADYPHKTFMILKAKDDGVNLAGQMGLKLYVTGHDDLFISENGKMSLWQDDKPYWERRASTLEPGNRQYYSRVCFRPNVVYRVITNKGKEAVHAYSVRGSDYDSKNKIVIPEYIQTPLLNKQDFVYYTQRPTWDAVAERLVTDETSRLDTTALTMADVVTQHIGTVYVRYTYSREDSPLTFPDGIGATTQQGLDLSGNTWYNMATRTLSEDSGLGTKYVYYNQLAYMKTETGMEHSSQFETLTDYGNGTPGLSDKRMLWRFVGDDPYAIRIYNGSMSGKYLSGIREANAFTFVDENSNAEIESFFLLRAKGQDDRMIRDDQAGLSFFISGQDFETRQTQSFINVLSKKISYYTNDAILKSSYSNTWQCYLLTSGSGGTSGGWVSFFKAPVARKYRYHAMNCTTGTPTETWSAVLEHDWLTPVVLEDDFVRLYAMYEKKSGNVNNDEVTGTNQFDTREGLTDVAQFYSDQEMKTRIYDNSNDVKTYDVYPTIDTDDIYDIYFKYCLDEESEVKGRKWEDLVSKKDDIAQDVQTYRGDDKQEGQGRLTKDTMRANWFFMVLDTDGDATKDVGKRMFLRREDDGSVGWMDNDYALHKDRAENYNSWTYHRLAEWYKAGDNDGFREGRWLWTFVGDDPYNIRLLNMESAVGVDAEGEGVYTLNGAEDCWTVASNQEITTTKNNVTTTTTTYPVSIPTEKPTKNDTWGLCNGYGSEGTISLQLPFTNETNHTTLYWQMADRVVGGRRANDRSNALLLLPYEPMVYEDVNLVIRRSDEVEQYKNNKIGLTDMKTGISKLYFAASERMFESGDIIDMSDEKSLPLNVRRAFCNYTLYSDVFKTVGGEYTITEGPYPTTVQATTEGTWSGTGEYIQKGDRLYDEDGKPVWTYRNADGTPAPGGAQSIYASYEVTSDVFLKSAPTEEEMKEMAANNDHVYFMDFPDANEKNPHHAYFEPQETFKSQTGDVTTKKVDGIYRTEKKKWDETKKEFVDDTDQIYNHSHFKTTDNRMTSVPERLKWYFVGDPYKVQVYCTAGAWGSNNASSNPQTVAANLCRFDPTETNFQFVVDCVHLRVPDYSNIDNRDTLIPTDEDGNLLTEEAFHNRHYNQPYFHDFYWECVPAVSDDENAFALRFKEDNDLLGYRNVYYYLAHDGLNKQYRSGGDNVTYKINLSYNPNNERHQAGTYAGYHAANDQNTVIKLVQPAKVYVTVNRKADGENRYDDKSKVVEDELSEYYGLGETITEVPRHLQRKFVQYGNLTNTKTGSSLKLTTENATSFQTCSAHSDKVHVTGTQIDPVFKFSVDYTVADLSNENNGAHYFTPSMGSTMQWLDMTVGNGNWLYYDKTNKTDDKENTTLVSNYRTAVNNNSANGWEDGLKGLHWAFVGDPYDFTIVNRRRYEDGDGNGKQWLVGTKTTIGDSIIWPTHLASSVAEGSETSTFATSSDKVTHWSLQMWKVAPQSGGVYQSGNSDGNYFLRTSSLKADENDAINGSSGNQTSNYWRMVRANYTSSTPASYFEAVPFSLSDLATYNNDKYSANYSASMNGLGVTQQLLEIRTAVAKDEDNANNDCFDANIYIYNKTTGELKAQLKHIELKYANIETALPQTLCRYGCKYPEAYQIYSVEGDGTFFSHLSTSSPITEFSAEALSTEKAITEDGKKYIEIAYLYTVTDDVAQFFTTQDEANKDEYLWANAYYKWNQTYSGTNQRIVYYEQEFDHYVYNAQGQIIDEVYKTVEKVRYETGTTTTPAYGWVNSHTDTEEAYGNVRLQSDDDALKWALVGDPYDFTLKNYAKYLVDDNSSLNSGGGTINFSLTDNARWALAQSTEPQKDADGKIVKDAQGKTQYQYYLALINGDGTILQYVTFDRAKNGQDLPSYEQYLKLQGSPIATDPTANRYNASDVKPFYLTGLLSLANTVVYHLVIAHQHSLDYEDAKTKEIADTINAHLEEFLKYKNKDYLNYIEEKTTDGGIRYYDYKSGATDEQRANLNNLLKTASLRDIVSFPIKDREVEGVGIGNRLNVPWYMRRQFCKYTLYQRDVLRSVTSDRPVYYKDANGNYTDANGNIVDADHKVQRTFVENGVEKPAYEIDWVSVTQYEGNDSQKLADKETVQQENGKPITKLNNSHRNRRVVVDVVYEVDPEQFRFSENGRNTTAWYSMMTNNKKDGLMNFSYKDGVGARQDRTYHYTNNYLWAPDGDPYGFVLRNRYATVNGTGWDDVVVTTKGHLPKDSTDTEITSDVAGTVPMYQATYTSQSSQEGLAKFVDERIVHFLTGAKRTDGTEVTTDGAANAIYEMFVGKTTNAFLMHPTSAWVDTDKDNFKSYFMKHIITDTHSKLVEEEANTILEDDDANWHLETTAEQLIPYFERAGYVGGLKPVEASKFENLSLYNSLQEYVKDETLPRDYSVIDKARKLVYGGKFYQNNNGSKGNVVEYTASRPAEGLIFESDNLINMTQGYYRIKAFSETALNKEEENISNTGVRGIVGPRYVSGYRFLSEASDSPCNLHFIETTEENATIHTYGALKEKIGNSNEMFDHQAMRGNIEILPVEYDPSSIFYFEPSSNDPFSRYTFGTQDMEVHARAGGSEGNGKTALKSKESEPATDFSKQFRIDDIGGTAVTLRTLKNGGTDENWNQMVENNIQTNYLCIDANHRYRISCQSNNELEENDSNNDGLGIQDTKWLLQPVGTQTEWPYNQMPLRVEVQKAEKTSATEERYNYYGSLYVPFDTRLSSTVDNAFTVTSSPSLTGDVGTIRLGSVSQINEKGNGQFIPAAWPVVMKTNSPKTGVWMTWNETTKKLEEDATHKRYYVNLALPTTTPTTVAGMIGDAGKIQLKGEYMEQKLEGVGGGSKVMVFGLPFKEVGGNTTTEDALTYYAYQDASTTDGTAKVGFYVNENWWREQGTDGKTENDGSAETSFLATARNATAEQRSNLYVYHNKVYYIYSGETPAKPRIIAIFDGDEELDDEPQEPEEQDFTEQKETPWPCDVYDLAGRKVATHETPQTLRQNHPGLPKGVYIFGHMKVLVK